MGYQDRYYYRDSPSDRMGPLQWLMSGSVPLFTAFGIRVRAHAAFVLFIVLELLLEPNIRFHVLATTLGLLFLSVLLHEFGHCFAARWVGGSADDILLWPLGGLAMAQPPRRPLPTFLTVAAGPAVNGLLALLCASILYFQQHVHVPLNPVRHFFDSPQTSWLGYYLWYFYMVNIAQLMFNLLPIYPLDGGQMLHSILWHWMGYGRSLLLASTVGIVGASLLMLYALAIGPQWLIFAVGITCLMYCIQQRTAVRAAGVYSFEDDDFRSPVNNSHPRHHHLSRFAKWKARRQILAEEQEQSKIDGILQKVHEQGMHSLTWLERRTLKRATQRQREMEETRYR